MSILGERTLIAQLCDEDSLRYLAREGINLEVVPNKGLHAVVEFSLRYFQTSGKAPSSAVLMEGYGDLLSDAEIDVATEPTETMQWAVEDLRSTHARKVSQSFTTEMAEAVSLADPADRVAVVGAFSARLARLASVLEPRRTQVDLRLAADGMIGAYDRRAANPNAVEGLRIGLPEVDAYLGGIRDGEIGLVAAPTKQGKSWLADHTALTDWQGGGSPALFTLENSIDMTLGRIACLALKLDPTEWEGGTLSAEDRALVVEWVEDVIKPAPNPLMIYQPLRDRRTPEALVQVALANGATSLVVDQLTFLNPGEVKRNQQRTYEVRDIIHDLAELISADARPVPCMLLHQINREGIKFAEKNGFLSLYHMAEAAEVERTAAHILGLYASRADQLARRAKLQLMASRRRDPLNWELIWNISNGLIKVRGEIDLSTITD